MERFVTYVEESLAKWLIEQAEAEQRSLSQVVARLLEEARLRNGEQQKT